MRLFSYSIITLAFALGLVLVTNPVQAASYGLTETAQESGYKADQTLTGTLNTIVSSALLLMGFIFFGYTLYAGLRWMTARGNDEMAQKAKDTLEAAIIGLVIILMSYALVRFIFTRVGPVGIDDGTKPNSGSAAYCTADSDCSGNEYCELTYNTCLSNLKTPSKGEIQGTVCRTNRDCKPSEYCDSKYEVCLPNSKLPAGSRGDSSGSTSEGSSAAGSTGGSVCKNKCINTAKQCWDSCAMQFETSACYKAMCMNKMGDAKVTCTEACYELCTDKCSAAEKSCTMACK